MDIRVRKIYKALFALEDLRELFRQALPTGLDEQEEEQFTKGRVGAIIRELKEGGNNKNDINTNASKNNLENS